MKRFSLVQAIIFGVSGIAILAAVLVFSLYRGQPNAAKIGNVTMWGTIPKGVISGLFEQNQTGDDLSNVSYVEITPDRFEKEFTDALAEGGGPDLVLLRENQIVENQSKLYRIPYANFDLRTYQDTFVDEANMLLADKGYLGMPFSIDPLVMYYNKDILNSAGIARPPETWTEMLSLVPQLSASDNSFNVTKSAIALGQYDNINNAREIIWSLIMQAGGDVVVRSDSTQAQSTKGFLSALSSNSNSASSPAITAINFYTQFTNPSKTIYSWNRSLPSSEEFFLSGDSAFYLGFASEMPSLRNKNPNLNFDVAQIPQSKIATKKTTYGRMYFVGITRNSKNVSPAYKTMLKLSSAKYQTMFSNMVGLPSIRRDLLAKSDPKNSFEIVFNKSALISRGVYEPNTSIKTIASSMIQSIVSGELKIEQAIAKAQDQINKALTE